MENLNTSDTIPDNGMDQKLIIEELNHAYKKYYLNNTDKWHKIIQVLDLYCPNCMSNVAELIDKCKDSVPPTNKPIIDIMMPFLIEIRYQLCKPYLMGYRALLSIFSDYSDYINPAIYLPLLMIYTLSNYCKSTGNTCCDYFDFQKIFMKEMAKKYQLLESIGYRHINTTSHIHLLYDQIIDELVEHKLIYLYNHTDLSHSMVYLYQEFHHEQSIAQNIIKLNQNKTNCYHMIQVNEIIQDVMMKSNQQLNIHQLCAIRNVFQAPISIIYGGPGTGKTTILGNIYNIQNQYCTQTKNKHVVLCLTPTNKACQRIQEIFKQLVNTDNAQHVHHFTIHRFIGLYNKAKVSENTKAVIPNEEDEINIFFQDAFILNKYTHMTFIIDEFSMVSNSLLYNLLSILREYNIHLVIIGDSNQLPSIDTGNVLLQLIESNYIVTTQLLTCYRQDEIHLTNQIEMIRNGICPIEVIQDNSFIWYKDYSDEESITTILKNICVDYKQQYHELFILSSTHSIINKYQPMIHNFINPYIPTTHLVTIPGPKKTMFRCGDYILQKANRCEDKLYNGLTGYITSIQKEENGWIVSYLFDSYQQKDNHQNITTVQYQNHSDFLDEIQHAYISTVHVSQGSERNCVVLFLPPGSTFGNRKLIYTAASRAKRKLIIISTPNTLQRFLQYEPMRISMLRYMIQDCIQSNTKKRKRQNSNDFNDEDFTNSDSDNNEDNNN